MELLLKSDELEVLEKGARMFLRRKLPDTAGELLEKAAKLTENAGDAGKARKLYFQAGLAAVAYKRPDWAQEMFDKADEHKEGARILSLKGWKAWGAKLLRQGDFLAEAEKMEAKARKSDIAARDNWDEAKRLQKRVEEAEEEGSASEGGIAEMKKLAVQHFKAAASASTRLRIHPLNPFAVMFYAQGNELEKAADRAIREKRPDWLVPISQYFSPSKTQIAKWARRVAKQDNHALAAELHEMTGDHANAGHSAMKAEQYLWAIREYKRAGMTLLAGRARRAAIQAGMKP